MHGFVPTAAGWASQLDALERDALLRVVTDVHDLMADSQDVPAAQSPDPIAHLDFTPGDRGPELEEDPALGRLFPPMSVSDPELATELRGLTVEELRRSKAANLRLVIDELRAGGDCVVVRRGEEDRWLAALTDVRLVLSSRLGIENDEDSQRVYDLAVSSTRDESPAETLEDELEMARASLYSGITWWQESLLLAVTRSGPEN